MTVTMTSDVHVNALHGLKQPCVTACCVRLPMIQAFQALQVNCVLEI